MSSAEKAASSAPPATAATDGASAPALPGPSPATPAEPGACDLSTGQLDRSRPLGVYVHFPFCSSRCPYCDFAVAVRPVIPHDEYARAILDELDARVPWFGSPSHRSLVSIYVGGGTPGLWEPDALGRVVDGIRRHFTEHQALEITVEANPGNLDRRALGRLRSLGINRVSLGAQAFQEPLLARIGRKHDAADIGAAVNAVRDAGFDNLCMDLMFGLPGQTMQDWTASLAAMVALAPEHITAYALTIEPQTRFGALDRAGKLERPADDEVALMYQACHETLASAGYEHYEISSYARKGRQSVHNSLYWTMGSYLGVGVSASSFRPLADGQGWRFSNQRRLDAYMRTFSTVPNGAADEIELRSQAQLEDEGLWLGLRLACGVDRAAHARRYGTDPLAPPGRARAAQDCAKAGWLQITDDRLRLSPAGFLFADEVAVRLGR